MRLYIFSCLFFSFLIPSSLAQNCQINQGCGWNLAWTDCQSFNQGANCMINGLSSTCQKQLCSFYQSQLDNYKKNCHLSCMDSNTNCQINQGCTWNWAWTDCQLFNQGVNCMINGLSSACQKQLCSSYQTQLDNYKKNCRLNCMDSNTNCQINQGCGWNWSSNDCKAFNQAMNCMISGSSSTCRKQICSSYQSELNSYGKKCHLSCDSAGNKFEFNSNLLLIFSSIFVAKFIF
uniref:Transmembrane protein n=1 Tax=Panagrolaimus sp. JU765 TaxID=591449 RepID=A0AC34R0X0_9BILA